MTSAKTALRFSLLLAAKDIRVEFRRRHEFLSILMFALSSILICSFAWRGTPSMNPRLISTAFWIVVFFSNILIMTTSFAREVDRGTIEGLRSLPCPPYTIFLGKVMYSLVILFSVATVIFLSSVAFLGLDVATLPRLSAVFSIVLIDLALLGSMTSALAMYSEGKTLLMSYIPFPISVPVLIPGTLATEKVISGMNLMEIIPELELLGAFMLAVTACSIILFRNVLME